MNEQRLRKSFLNRRALVSVLTVCLLGCSSVSQSSVNRSSLTNNNQPSNENGAIMEDQKNKPGNDKVDARLAAASSNFGFKLYNEVVKQSAGKNTFISPASVGLCLAMAFNGAEGETKEAMARALSVNGMSMEELNRAYAGLKAALESADP